jgi:hypothetical protein
MKVWRWLKLIRMRKVCPWLGNELTGRTQLQLLLQLYGALSCEVRIQSPREQTVSAEALFRPQLSKNDLQSNAGGHVAVRLMHQIPIWQRGQGACALGCGEARTKGLCSFEASPPPQSR